MPIVNGKVVLNAHTSTGSNFQLTPAEETAIINSNLVGEELQLRNIKSIRRFSDKDGKRLRKMIRNQIGDTQLLEKSELTIAEIKKNLAPISAFGQLTQLDCYGYKTPGNNSDNSFFIFLPKEKTPAAEGKKETKK
jgi:hypothetical protein